MDALGELESALRERRRVIADHGWRERDADGHLAALRQVSERISELSTTIGVSGGARLKHFLDNCSYDKALSLLSGEMAAPGGGNS